MKFNLKNMETTQEQMIIKIIKYTIIGVIVLLLIATMFGSVKQGQVGIKTRFSAVTGKVLQPGLYMKLPLIESVKKMDVQTQKEQVEATAASKDLQNVTTTIALNYSIDQSKVVELYSSIGLSYKERVIDPYIQESVKATTANFTAEELITKREVVSDEIKTHLSERLSQLGILTQGLSIVDFKFSASFNEAIESKVTAEQNALAAKNKLAQVQYEAQQAVEEAKGKAEALRIESSAINSNPQILQLRAIEKWNGVMPQVTGGSTPFVNIK